MDKNEESETEEGKQERTEGGRDREILIALYIMVSCHFGLFSIKTISFTLLEEQMTPAQNVVSDFVI